jgi:hypothetical protein
MRALSLGPPFAAGETITARYDTASGHELRSLAPEGETADYHYTAAESLSAALARISRDWRPDAVLVWQPEMFPPPPGIEECDALTVALISDWNIHWPQLEKNCARYDLVLTDRLGAGCLRPADARPEYIMPLYSHDSAAHYAMDIEKDIDVLFIGNMNHAIHAGRARCLEQLARLPHKYNIAIRSGIFGEAYTRTLNRAKIIFNFSARSEMNMRVFEAIACGALLFLEEDNLETPQYLEPGTHYTPYTPENMIRKLTDALENTAERERVAAAGHAEAEKLAGENRLDALLDSIAQRKTGPRGFARLPMADQAAADILQYAYSQRAEQRNLAIGYALAHTVLFPEDDGVLAAAVCAAVSCIRGGRPDPGNRLSRFALEWAGSACANAPSCVVHWLNMARLFALSDKPDAAAVCLEKALEGESAEHGGLLLGVMNDPAYAAWLRALATRKTRIEMLHAMAARHLAEHHYQREEYAAARDMAAQSTALNPRIPEAWRQRALAEAASGRTREAAEALEAGLPHTAFDANWRSDLTQLRRELGEKEKARELALYSARLFEIYLEEDTTSRHFRELAEKAGADTAQK